MTIVSGNLTPEQHETQRELFAARHAKIEELIDGEARGEILENGFEVPAEPGRFLAVEFSCGDPVWAMNADDLRTVAHDIEASDTRRDDVYVTDLDTGKEYRPEIRIMAFWCEGERVNFDNLKVVAE